MSRYVSDDPRDEFENFTTANGLADNKVGALGEDRDGNLWVATAGFQKLSRAGFVTYSRQDGLALNDVVSIFEDRSGELCVITRDSRVNCFDGRRFHSTLLSFPNQMLPGFWGSNQITFQDHRGQWWVPTGQGLFRFTASKFAGLGSAHPDAIDGARRGVPGAVFRIFEDSRGDVWISTWISNPVTANGALMRWERATGTIHRYSAADGVPPAMASAYAEDRNGNVWIAFTGTLIRYSQGIFRAFQQPKGLCRADIRSLFADDEDRLWAAFPTGLVRIDSPESTPGFTVYTTDQGLGSNDVQSITEDRWGRIYVGTGRGADCFYPETPLHVRHYTKVDGLALGNEMEAFRDRHGTLWFGTNMGLSRLGFFAQSDGTDPHWETIGSIGAGENATAVSSANGTTVFVGTDQGNICRLTNPYTGPCVDFVVNQSPASRITGILGFFSAIGMATTNSGNVLVLAGQAWNVSDGALPTNQAFVSVDGPGLDSVFVTNGLQVFITHDLGTTWLGASQGLPAQAQAEDLHFDGSGHMYLATYGWSLFAATLP